MPWLDKHIHGPNSRRLIYQLVRFPELEGLDEQERETVISEFVENSHSTAFQHRVFTYFLIAQLCLGVLLVLLPLPVSNQTEYIVIYGAPVIFVCGALASFFKYHARCNALMRRLIALKLQNRK